MYMKSTVVEVGDTEVEIRETDDGFEAVEHTTTEDDTVDVPHLRAAASGGEYGCEIPLHADFRLEDGTIYWMDEDDVSDMRGWDPGTSDTHPRYDSGAHVSEFEIVNG